MSKRRKANFYIRVRVRDKAGADGFYFQKVSGWIETFQTSDGTPVQFAFHRDRGFRWCNITEVSTGLGCGVAETFEAAEQVARERVDVIAKILQTPEKIRFAQELEHFIRFEEEEDERMFFENQTKR